jgi:hypothetical protein
MPCFVRVVRIVVTDCWSAKDVVSVGLDLEYDIYLPIANELLWAVVMAAVTIEYEKQEHF